MGEQCDVTLSADIGSLGLLERENSSVINASLRPLARVTIRGFLMALKALKMPFVPLFLCQNDGTLMTCEEAMLFPIKTFASGRSITSRRQFL